MHQKFKLDIFYFLWTLSSKMAMCNAATIRGWSAYTVNYVRLLGKVFAIL